MNLLRSKHHPRKDTAMENLTAYAARSGLKIETHSPGDGLRIRIFRAGDPSDFFGPSNAHATLLGATRKQSIELATTWIDGWNACRLMG